MAPVAGFWRRERRGDNNNGGDGKNSNNNDGGDGENTRNGDDKFGNGNDNNSGNSSSNDPVKVIKVTHTVTTTAVQTSLVAGATSANANESIPPVTQQPPSISQSPSSPLTSASTSTSTSIIQTGTPSSSTTSSFPPQNTSTLDSGPTNQVPATNPSGSASVPFASIISVILSCLFFITLCLVIYVRNPTLPGRIMSALRRNNRRRPIPPTISSFETKEYKVHGSNGRSESHRTYLSLTDPVSDWSWLSRSVAGHSMASRAGVPPAIPEHVYSPSMADVNFRRGSKPSTGSSRSRAGYNASRVKTSGSFSTFEDEYPVDDDGDTARLAQRLAEWQATMRMTRTSGSVPRSVTVESADMVR